MGEGEWSPIRVRIQPLWELQTTDQAVPSPVGRERVRVRVKLLELRLLLGIYFCTSPKEAGFGAKTTSAFGSVEQATSLFWSATCRPGLDEHLEGMQLEKFDVAFPPGW